MDPGLYFLSKGYFSESSITLRHQAISSYSPGKACKIIFGAIEYARRLGFKPQKDFDLSQYVLEGLQNNDWDLTFKFGLDIQTISGGRAKKSINTSRGLWRNSRLLSMHQDL